MMVNDDESAAASDDDDDDDDGDDDDDDATGCAVILTSIHPIHSVAGHVHLGVFRRQGWRPMAALGNGLLVKQLKQQKLPLSASSSSPWSQYATVAIPQESAVPSLKPL